MQFVNRSHEPPPPVFRTEAAAAMRAELARFMDQPPSRRAQQTPPSQSLVFDDEVFNALVRVFEGKCAFCETKAPLGAHRFRPVSDAEPLANSAQAHLYYCWLGTDWGNVYAICPGCSRQSARLFPVRGGVRGALPKREELAEFAKDNYGLWRWPHRDRPLLLNPCGTRDYARHLEFDLSGGVRGLTQAGASTIDVFRLDRDDLVLARREAFERYVDILGVGTEPLAAPFFDFSLMEYGGAWYLLLRRLVLRISERLDQPLVVTRSRIRRTLEEVLRTPRGRVAYRAALDDVRAPGMAAKAPRGPKRLEPRRLALEAPRRLVSVEVENFKALEYLRIDLKTPLPADASAGRERGEAAAMLVLGENAAGKSSILEAVALGLVTGAARDRLKRAPDAFVLNPALMGAEASPAPAEARVRLLFEDGERSELRIGRAFEDTAVLDNLPQVFGYGAFRQYSDKGRRVTGGGTVATLFHSDVVLRNPEEWLLKLDEPTFALAVRALREIFSVEGEFDVIERDPVENRCLIVSQVGDGIHARYIRTPLSVASSGFRSVLAMACDVLQGLLGGGRRLTALSDARPVILIDEVEAHLHPRWKMGIMSALRRMLPNATFLVTTHDPLCLRGMHDREVVVLKRIPKIEPRGGEGLPVFVESTVELPNVENLTVEQLLTSDLFEMFSTDSPEVERRLANLSSWLALRDAGAPLTEEARRLLAQVEAEVAEVMPLGSTRVQRLILEAVGEYVRQRPGLAGSALVELERGTRDLIVSALAGYG